MTSNRASPTHARHGSVGDSEPPRKRARMHQSTSDVLAREIGLMRNTTGTGSASFVGSASGIHFVRSLFTAVGTSSTDHNSPHMSVVPGEEDQLPEHHRNSNNPIACWNQHEIDAAGNNTPSFEQFMAWTSSYFDNWHPMLPFLHAPSILKTLEQLSRADAETKSSLLQSWDGVIVKGLMSISMMDRRETGQSLQPVPLEYLFTSYDDALAGAQLALTRSSTLRSLQAGLVVQLFLTSMLRLNTASRLGGLLVQMSFQIGLHRCPSRYQSFNLAEIQLRKRVFWSMYSIERFLCQALGLPVMLQDEDVDVCHLNDEKHECAAPSSVSTAPSKMSDVTLEGADNRLQLLCFVARHAQLRGSIINLRNKRIHQRDQSPEAAIVINARIKEWYNEVEDFLDSQEGQSTPSLKPLHAKMLTAFRQESIIMLYRPLLALPKDNANYIGAIHACIGAAKSVLTTLSSLLEDRNGSTSTKTPMIWPSFTWSAWMSAFILLYASIENKIDFTVVERHVGKALAILEHLNTRGSVWPGACAHAVRDLKDNLQRRHNSSSTVTSPEHRDGASVVNGSDEIEASQQARTVTTQRLRATSTPAIQRPHLSHLDSGIVRANNPAIPRQNVTSQPQSWLSNNPVPQGLVMPSELPDSQTSGLLVPEQYFEPSFDPALLPQDLLPTAFGGCDPFQGFDIPFWLGQDNYAAYLQSTNGWPSQGPDRSNGRG